MADVTSVLNMALNSL